MNIYNDKVEIPIGLGMALSKDLDKMNYFSSLNEEQQKEIISQAHGINSKQEMQQFVENLAR